jgi:Co/Zn/Cd efflux system component
MEPKRGDILGAGLLALVLVALVVLIVVAALPG